MKNIIEIENIASKNSKQPFNNTQNLHNNNFRHGPRSRLSIYVRR